MLTDINSSDQGPELSSSGDDATVAAADSGTTNQPPVQLPFFRQNGSDTLIPATISGTGDHPPGALATYIKRLDYSKAHFRNSDRLKSDVLEVMNLMPAQRDPVLRLERTWTGVKLDRIINERIENIESALLQVVGAPAEQPCDPCQRGQGPWNSCVILEGSTTLTACAGCRFRANDTRCTHYQPPRPDAAEMERQEREIKDLCEEIDGLKQRIAENETNIHETTQTMGVLRLACQGNIADDEGARIIAVLSETLQFHNQQVSQVHADKELLAQHNKEYDRLIREAALVDEAATPIHPLRRHSAGSARR